MIQVSEFKNVLEVMDYFKEESTCKNYLEQKRWGGTVCCPDCGKTKIYRTNRGFRCADRDCDRKFTVRVGTVMEHSRIKLRLWFAAMYLISAHKKGVSSLQIARDLGVCQKTAWFMNHRIRKILSDNDTQKFTVSVSADETFIGGKNKNRHKNKKIPNSQGRSSADKTPVLGIKEKGGKIRTFKVKNTETDTLQPILVANIEKGAVLMTDEWGGYSGKSNTKIGTVRDYISESIRNVNRQIPNLKDVVFSHGDYKHLSLPENAIVYCDIPYKGTKQYATSKGFNHAEFWDWCRRIGAQGHTVFVSEYEAPDDFLCVWSKDVASSLSANGVAGGNKISTEKLFTIN